MDFKLQNSRLIAVRKTFFKALSDLNGLFFIVIYLFYYFISLENNSNKQAFVSTTYT